MQCSTVNQIHMCSTTSKMPPQAQAWNLYRQHIHQLCLFRVYFLKLFKCLIEFFAIILPHCKDYYYNFSEDVVLSDLLKNKAINKSEKRNAHFPLSSLAFRSILKSLQDWTINLAASVWTLKQAIHCYLQYSGQCKSLLSFGQDKYTYFQFSA